MNPTIPYQNKTYFIYTFGCQINEHDSEVLSGMLEGSGYLPAPGPEEADLIVINTCAVRLKPEQKVAALLGKLKPLKEENPDLVIAVGGCMAQQPEVAAALARRFKYLDLIFGTHALPRFPRLLKQAGESRRPLVDIEEHADSRSELPIRRISRFKAWLPVIYGCNNFCSYCIVPYVRGRERSRPKEEVIAEATSLAGAGYLELTLLGQNVNSYGLDNRGGERYEFADLLLDINRIQGLSRIRFLTSHPKDLSSRLIEAVRTADKVCAHFHLPVQVGSNRLLKSMHRRYTRERYLELIQEIREAIPTAAITTDLIVGYPGEGEKDFYETLDLVKEVRFDNAFIFIYSPRKGTKAAEKEDNIPLSEKKNRLLLLSQTQNQISLEINRTLVGTNEEILVEGASKRNPRNQSGRTRTNKLVHFPADRDLTGRLVNVDIVDAYTWHLTGEIPRI